jgi:hypothetical protein
MLARKAVWVVLKTDIKATMISVSSVTTSMISIREKAFPPGEDGPPSMAATSRG